MDLILLVCVCVCGKDAVVTNFLTILACSIILLYLKNYHLFCYYLVSLSFGCSLICVMSRELPRMWRLFFVHVILFCSNILLSTLFLPFLT